MKKLAMMLVALLATASVYASTSELDPVSTDIPRGLVVRIAPDGKREIFRSNLNEGIVANDAMAAATIEATVKSENMIENVNPVSELDRTSSQNSWHWSWGPRNECYRGGNGYGYGYRSGRSTYNYSPSYSYNRGGYQYNSYYSNYHYGRHTGFHYSDRSGYHYGGHRGWHDNGGHSRF